MITSKKLRYLVLIAFFITIPVHPKNFLGYCKDLFHGQVSTKAKIGLGIASLTITSLLAYIIIKCIKQAPQPKPSPALTPEFIADRDFLRKKGFDIENIDRDDLIKAINENDEELILKLLKYNAPIGCKFSWAKFDQFPLGSATMKSASLIELLLKNAKNVDQKILDDAISFAIERGNFHDNCNRNLPVLLQYKKNSAPFLTQAALHNPVALEILIQHAKLNESFAETDASNALLNVAKADCSQQQLHGIIILLKHGANVNEKQFVKPEYQYQAPLYKQVKTPLSEAVLHGQLPTVRFLLKQGAQLVDPNNGVNIYEYLKDMPKNSELARICKTNTFIALELHRLREAKSYVQESEKELGKYLSRDVVNITEGYITPMYPLMEKHSLRVYVNIIGKIYDDNHYEEVIATFKQALKQWPEQEAT